MGNHMSIDPTGGHPAMDYPEHQRTYAGFIRGFVVLSIAVALLLIWMLIFLV